MFPVPLDALDLFVSRFAQELRFAPLTGLFVLASAWWVKSVLVIGIGGVCDAARRRLPASAACAAAAFAVAGIVVHVLKETVDRMRPPVAYPDVITAVGTIPSSPSFPSGHAATAFATAAVVASFYPRLRWPLYGLAALVALSRLYLGVHFGLDVAAGAALGLGVGLGVVWASRRVAAVASRAWAPAA